MEMYVSEFNAIYGLCTCRPCVRLCLCGSGLLWEMVVFLIIQYQRLLSVWLNKYWKLDYKILVFVDAKCNQLHVVVQMESVYHQIIIWVSCLYDRYNLIENISQFEGVTSEIGKYHFAKILIADAYMHSWVINSLYRAIYLSCTVLKYNWIYGVTM